MNGLTFHATTCALTLMSIPEPPAPSRSCTRRRAESKADLGTKIETCGVPSSSFDSGRGRSAPAKPSGLFFCAERKKDGVSTATGSSPAMTVSASSALPMYVTMRITDSPKCSAADALAKTTPPCSCMPARRRPDVAAAAAAAFAGVAVACRRLLVIIATLPTCS